MSTRTSAIEVAKRDHPESPNGYWYTYEDDASYREVLGSIVDVLERHALPMLDAECGRGGRVTSGPSGFVRRGHRL